MAFEIVTQPIDVWPGPETKPRIAPLFKAGYADTIKLLRTELEALGAKGAVAMQVVTKNGATDLRRDGVLRAQAQISHPGVRISFESKHGPLTYATDQYEKSYYNQMDSWKANLRAIALSLGALRAVDRYGVSKLGEQYKGWLAIENSAQSRDDLVLILEKYAGPEATAMARGLQASDQQQLKMLWANAKRKTHPDANGGDREAWDAAESAARALGLA